MRQDLALAVAAAEVPQLDKAQVAKVIDAYALVRAMCAACENDLDSGECQRCTKDKRWADQKGDVEWVCHAYNNPSRCVQAHSQRDATEMGDHPDCGPVLKIKLDIDAFLGREPLPS